MKRIVRGAARRGLRAYSEAVAILPNPKLTERLFLLEQIVEQALPRAISFDAERFCEDVHAFVESLRVDGFWYRYSASVKHATLYSSVYACLIYALTGKLANLPVSAKKGWVEYFDRHQSSSDGMFRDSAVANKIFEEADWWGARHLVIHMLPAYVALGARPKHKLSFLGPYKRESFLRDWLDREDWRGVFSYANDVDNKIMNIATVLQYERDYAGDEQAARAVAFLEEYLLERVNSETGMWGACDQDSPVQLSRTVQFAYHLLAMFFYDGIEVAHADKLIELALKTQNRLGGFGVAENSSACEDIDSIDILTRLRPYWGDRLPQVRLALTRALAWVLSNQNGDGGFVFRRNSAFEYGHRNMSSKANASALFPTWFRVLTVAKLHSALTADGAFAFDRCPGLQF